MPSKPETAIVKRIMEALRERGAKVIKVHGSLWMERGSPDLIGCWQGRALALEVKRPGERAQPLQAKRLAEWREAGAIACVVESAEQALAALEML